MMKRVLSILASLMCLLALAGCALPEELRFVNPTEYVEWEPTEPKPTEVTPPVQEATPTVPPSRKTASQITADLTDEQLVAQLFLIKCPADGVQELLGTHHVGGIILCDQNINGETPDSLRAELTDCQSYVPIPLLVAVDEEGGLINPVSNHAAFRSEPFPSNRELYYEGGLKALRECETEKSQLLRSVGINVNLAPVCDVVTEEGARMASRSLFLTAKATGEAVSAMVKTMQKNGVGAVLKHFPGFGNLTGDTNTAEVVDDRSLEQLYAYDLVPFKKGIEANAGAVMIGHSIVNKIDSKSPASLSEAVHMLLRTELGFKGVIMTDDLTQAAISDTYEDGEAAVQAIKAGNDMIITTWSEVRYEAILEAMNNGRLDKNLIRESVKRIIQWKMDLGLL